LLRASSLILGSLRIIYELVIKARKPNTSYSSLGPMVMSLGLMTGRRQGVSSSHWRVCRRQMRANPSRLTSSNIGAPFPLVILKVISAADGKGIYPRQEMG